MLIELVEKKFLSCAIYIKMVFHVQCNFIKKVLPHDVI